MVSRWRGEGDVPGLVVACRKMTGAERILHWTVNSFAPANSRVSTDIRRKGEDELENGRQYPKRARVQVQKAMIM